MSKAQTYMLWRYAWLAMPLAFVALPLYVHLPHHYASEFGLSLAWLGSLLLFSRLFDAAIDPLLGRFVDKLFAKGLPALRLVAMIAGLCLALGFLALWFPPQASKGIALTAWLVGALLITYVSFSCLSILHQAWGTRWGGDAHLRARVAGWREGLAVLGVMMASVLPTYFGFGWTSLVLAALLGVGLVCLLNTPFHPQGSSPVAAAGPQSQSPWAVGAFGRLMAVFTLNGTASSMAATLLPFFVADALQAPNMKPAFLLVYFLAAGASVPLWLRAVKRWGLARLWLVGMGLAILAFLPVPWLRVGGAWVFLLICAITGFALGADLMLPAALLTGVLQRSGLALQSEGRALGWWAFATKMNLAFAAGLALPLLQALGYEAGTTDPQGLMVLTVAYATMPCVLKLLAMLLLWRFQATIASESAPKASLDIGVTRSPLHANNSPSHHPSEEPS